MQFFHPWKNSFEDLFIQNKNFIYFENFSGKKKQDNKFNSGETCDDKSPFKCHGMKDIAQDKNA